MPQWDKLVAVLKAELRHNKMRALGWITGACIFYVGWTIFFAVVGVENIRNYIRNFMPSLPLWLQYTIVAYVLFDMGVKLLWSLKRLKVLSDRELDRVLFIMIFMPGAVTPILLYYHLKKRRIKNVDNV